MVFGAFFFVAACALFEPIIAAVGRTAAAPNAASVAAIKSFFTGSVSLNCVYAELMSRLPAPTINTDNPLEVLHRTLPSWDSRWDTEVCVIRVKMDIMRHVCHAVQEVEAAARWRGPGRL
jgi:hypothetical protein